MLGLTVYVCLCSCGGSTRVTDFLSYRYMQQSFNFFSTWHTHSGPVNSRPMYDQENCKVFMVLSDVCVRV